VTDALERIETCGRRARRGEGANREEAGQNRAAHEEMVGVSAGGEERVVEQTETHSTMTVSLHDAMKDCAESESGGASRSSSVGSETFQLSREMLQDVPRQKSSPSHMSRDSERRATHLLGRPYQSARHLSVIKTLHHRRLRRTRSSRGIRQCVESRCRPRICAALASCREW